MTNSTNRLANIVARQRGTRARDFVFAAVLALAGVIGVSGVSTATAAAATHVAR